MAKQRNILFNPSNKQLYVNYTDGGKAKRKYLGKAKNKSDRPAKRKANAVLKVWSDEREIAEAQVRIHLHYKAVLDGTKPISSLPPAIAGPAQKAADGPAQPMPKLPSQMTPEELEEYLDLDETLADMTAKQLLYSRSSAERIANPKKGKTTVVEHIKAWLASERLKVGTKQLTAKSMENKVKGIQQFEEHANGDYFNGNVEAMLASYRAKLDMKIAAGEYKGNTAQDKVKHLRVFIGWCWKNRKLQEMPRNMDDVCRPFDIEKGGDPMDLPDIKKLWAEASDRQKCFIALGLNCGMKPGDITALKGSQLKGNRLRGYRPKTTVPFNMKLWPITVKLIAKCRDRHGDDEHIFVNQAGERIGTDSFGQVYKKLTTKARVCQKKTKSRKGEPLPCVFSQLRDTSVDLFEKKLLELGHDGGLKKRFLQQSESDNTAYYTNHVPENMQSDKLDEITDYLGEVYGLKL